MHNVATVLNTIGSGIRINFMMNALLLVVSQNPRNTDKLL